MKQVFFFLGMLFAAILTACAKQLTSDPSTVPTIEKPALTATANTKIHLTASNNPANSTSQTATSPTTNIREGCIRIESAMPADLTLSGVWVLNSRQPFLEDIRTHTQTGMPMRGDKDITDITISPNGKIIAYLETYLDKSTPNVPRTGKAKLQVVRSSGVALNMDYWLPDWQTLIGWVDNENLAIAIATAKPSIVILNPATGAWKNFEQPAWVLDNYRKETGSSIRRYAPTLHWFLDDKNDNDQRKRIKNVQTGETTWQTDQPIGDATWAADGNTLSFLMNNNIYILKNGVQTGKLETGRLGYDQSGGLTLSPDGEKLAFWSSKTDRGESSSDAQPTLYNIPRHELGRLCTNGVKISYDWQRNSIIWSPDSRYYIQNVYTGTSQYLLVDTQEMHAYLLENNSSENIIGWLVKS